MNSVPGIKKYYIGFGVLLVLMVGCLIYVVSQAGATKTDRQTNDVVEKIASKLDTNISTVGDTPVSLQAAGINGVPSTIEYTRLSSSSYKICIDYKTGSSGFDAGWSSLLLGGIYGSTSNPTPSSTDKSYFDSTIEFTHKKGQNCQTVTPYIYSGLNDSGSSLNSNNGVYVTCSSYSQTYMGRRTAKIASINTANETINLDATYTQTFEDGSGFVSSPTTVQSMTYNTITSFYDPSCQKITAADLKPGQIVAFYVSSQTDTFAGNIEVQE